MGDVGRYRFLEVSVSSDSYRNEWEVIQSAVKRSQRRTYLHVETLGGCHRPLLCETSMYYGESASHLHDLAVFRVVIIFRTLGEI